MSERADKEDRGRVLFNPMKQLRRYYRWLFLNDAMWREQPRVDCNDNKLGRSGIDVIVSTWKTTYHHGRTQCCIPDVLTTHRRMICGNTTVINVANCFQFNSRQESPLRHLFFYIFIEHGANSSSITCRYSNYYEYLGRGESVKLCR